MDSNSAVSSLTALAQATRLAIFRLLVQAGPDGLCVGDIGSKLDLAPATLSFHLKELSNAGLLAPRQEGRFIYYVPNFDEMNALVSYLMENCCAGQTCGPVCKPVARKRKEKVT
jgi:ArsR family transcriptional regulator, arsenate/arsenite/antimonite-responsive transcriptional repressor